VTFVRENLAAINEASSTASGCFWNARALRTLEMQTTSWPQAPLFQNHLYKYLVMLMGTWVRVQAIKFSPVMFPYLFGQVMGSVTGSHEGDTSAYSPHHTAHCKTPTQWTVATTRPRGIWVSKVEREG